MRIDNDGMRMDDNGMVTTVDHDLGSFHFTPAV